ncbi:MAG TPA: SHOCT domain-containing protein [Anaerolineales bacterium]|nr:SHOCT domain-containing protein [Anaerolineales bacterium]
MSDPASMKEVNMMGGGMMGGYGFGSFGLIGMILNLVITVGLIVGIVLLVAWLVRRLGSQGGAFSAGQQPGQAAIAPREILQARYARGEIKRDEYQQMLSDLG